MLAHYGVIFAERHLFSDVARVFLGHVEEARVSGADQLDLDRGWLRHGPFLLFKKFRKKTARKKDRAVHRWGPMRIRRRKVKPISNIVTSKTIISRRIPRTFTFR